MNEMTQEISEIKVQISRKEWEQQIRACQQSGMSAHSWYQENGVTTGAYHHHLRKIRETMLQEIKIIPLAALKPAESAGIRIEADEITVILPETAATDQLTAILSVLRSC